MGIAELEPDVFYVSVCDVFASWASSLWRVDMRSFSSTTRSVTPALVLVFPETARLLNGSAALSSTTMLVADSWADLIWRVDVPLDHGPVSVRVWLQHDMLAHSRDPAKSDVPGVNGLKYNTRDRHVYFTCTAQTIFGRVKVDPESLEAVGGPEEVASRGMWADDLIVDEDEAVAYVTTHRQSTIEKVFLTGDGSFRQESVAGSPINLDLLGPTAGAWRRGNKADKDKKKVAYFTTDGGCKNPHEGVVREAKVLRLEFA